MFALNICTHPSIFLVDIFGVTIVTMYVSGVTSHGLSCEVCKCKVHKRCASKAISNCKWTTLASVGKDIIEDKDGVSSNFLMDLNLNIVWSIYLVFYTRCSMFLPNNSYHQISCKDKISLKEYLLPFLCRVFIRNCL